MHRALGSARSAASQLLFLALGVLASGSFACKSRSHALTKWAWIDGKLEGADCPAKGSSVLKGTLLSLDFDPIPPKTTITVAGKDYVDQTKLHLDIDLGDKIGAIPMKELLTAGYKLDPQIPIVLVFPSGTIKTEAPTITDPLIEIKSGVGKPLLFGAEPPPPPAATAHGAHATHPNLLWLGSNDELMGTAATFRDVDWIAAEGPDMASVPGPNCKYRDPQTGATSTVPLTLLAPQIVIYDRRTARVIDKKTFVGAGSCPLEKDKADKSVADMPSEDTIKRWLKERRVK